MMLVSSFLHRACREDGIMFWQDLEDLPGLLNAFQYHVLLPRPDVDWPGTRGLIGRDFISKKVRDFRGRRVLSLQAACVHGSCPPHPDGYGHWFRAYPAGDIREHVCGTQARFSSFRRDRFYPWNLQIPERRTQFSKGNPSPRPQPKPEWRYRRRAGRVNAVPPRPACLRVTYT
jgi:hypothetical protein